MQAPQDLFDPGHYQAQESHVGDMFERFDSYRFSDMVVTRISECDLPCSATTTAGTLLWTKTTRLALSSSKVSNRPYTGRGPTRIASGWCTPSRIGCSSGYWTDSGPASIRRPSLCPARSNEP